MAQTERAAASPPPPTELAPAVKELVANHDAGQCTAEGVALAVAATRAAVSLVKAVASAPTEIGLVYTVGGFIVDSMTLAATAANFANCEESKAAQPPK